MGMAVSILPGTLVFRSIPARCDQPTLPISPGHAEEWYAQHVGVGRHLSKAATATVGSGSNLLTPNSNC